MATFRFRAVSPLFDIAPFSVHGAPDGERRGAVGAQCDRASGDGGGGDVLIAGGTLRLGSASVEYLTPPPRQPPGLYAGGMLELTLNKFARSYFALISRNRGWFSPNEARTFSG